MRLRFNYLASGRIVPLFALLFMLYLCCLPPVNAQTKNCQWVLEQKSDLLGKIIAVVSRDAAKIVNSECGYQILAKAPDWTVHCFRNTEKMEWTGSLDDFNGAMVNSPFRTSEVKEDRLLPSGKGMIKGLKYTRYATSAQSLAAIYCADDIPVSPKCAAFLSRCYDSANCGKVPLYRSEFKVSGKPLPHGNGSFLNLDAGEDMRSGLVIDLMTKSWKQVPFNASDFEVPHGYRRLKRIEQVAFSPNQKKNLTEVFDGLGFASDEKGSHKKLQGKPSGQSSISP